MLKKTKLRSYLFCHRNLHLQKPEAVHLVQELLLYASLFFNKAVTQSLARLSLCFSSPKFLLLQYRFPPVLILIILKSGCGMADLILNLYSVCLGVKIEGATGSDWSSLKQLQIHQAQFRNFQRKYWPQQKRSTRAGVFKEMGMN